jgi:hypothetical protein
VLFSQVVRAFWNLVWIGSLLVVSGCESPRNATNIRYAQSPDFGTCINELRELEGAKEEWAVEHKIKDTNAEPTLDDLRPYMMFTGSRDMKWCPSGGTYRIGKVCEPPTCSFGGPGHTLDIGFSNGTGQPH